MPKKKGSTREEVERRLERVEAMLDSGVPPSSVEMQLSREYGLTRRQVANYIKTVDKRAAARLQQEGPYFRTRLILKTRRFFAKCLADKRHGDAAKALQLEAKLTLASVQRNPVVQKMLDDLGPPPADPSKLVAWGQQLMSIKMYDVATNPAIDPIRQVQIIGDLGAKLGIVQDKAEVERQLAALEERAAIVDAEIEHADEKPEGAASGD